MKKKSPKVAIVANGEINNYAAAKAKIAEANYLIACDGGLLHFNSLDATPHCLIGDFDSTPAKLLEAYKAQGIPAFPFPTDKNDTDLALAVAHALMFAPESITIVGASGGRVDHALGNIQLLAHIGENFGDTQAEIWDETTSIRLVHAQSCCEIFYTFPREQYSTLSLLPLGTRATGITTRGLKYELENDTLRIGETRGISNEFVENTAEISVESGLLLVIRSK